MTPATPEAGYRIRPAATGIETGIAHPPAGFSILPKRFIADLPGGPLLSVIRTRSETFRPQPGWALFFFDLSSPIHGRSVAEPAALAVGGDSLAPARSNIAGMRHDFGNSSVWNHGEAA